MDNIADMDTALRVVVSPSQSSYFAGEPLQVTITITNTRSASEPAPQPSIPIFPPRHAHKRSAHSVSSAPLARPPTSPGLIRSTSSTAVPSSSKLVSGNGLGVNSAQRKGLVGVRDTPADHLHPEIQDVRKRISAKSLSVDILPSQMEDHLKQDDPKGKTPQRLGQLIFTHPATVTLTKRDDLAQSPPRRASPPPLPAHPVRPPIHPCLRTTHTLVNPPSSKSPPTPQIHTPTRILTHTPNHRPPIIIIRHHQSQYPNPPPPPHSPFP